MTDAVMMQAESIPNDVYAANTVPKDVYQTNVKYIRIVTEKENV